MVCLHLALMAGAVMLHWVGVEVVWNHSKKILKDSFLSHLSAALGVVVGVPDVFLGVVEEAPDVFLGVLEGDLGLFQELVARALKRSLVLRAVEENPLSLVPMFVMMSSLGLVQSALMMNSLRVKEA